VSFDLKAEAARLGVKARSKAERVKRVVAAREQRRATTRPEQGTPQTVVAYNNPTRADRRGRTLPKHPAKSGDITRGVVRRTMGAPR